MRGCKFRSMYLRGEFEGTEMAYGNKEGDRRVLDSVK